MANANIVLNAIDNTRAAFLAVQQKIRGVEIASAGASRRIMRTGFGIVGAGGLGILLARQIREVITNIESIPGVPDNVAASVLALKSRFTELNQTMQRGIATAFSWFTQLGQNIGLTVGAMVYGVDAASDAMNALAAEQSKALEDLRKANLEKKLAPLRVELERVKEAAADAMAPFAGATLTASQRVDAFRAKWGNLMVDLGKTDPDTEAGLKRQIEIYGELRTTAIGLKKAEEDRSRIVRDASKLMAEGFEEAIFSGKKLSEVIRQLGQDILRLVFRNMITTPLANALTGGLGKIFGFADGGLPPTGRASIVGERGPELFIPGTSGRIVPNHELGGSGGGGSTYYIDARGADQTGLARLEGLIRQTQASIRPIALGAVSDARMRGGAFAG